ncbi:MAG TPA: Rho termination factor N-terminal domain-containing protein, partial [Steroidobacteraceae bacterium]|nr:Rho termination factor N-terminal domain-containing protein [Steroidobacteraceae bacterium]
MRGYLGNQGRNRPNKGPRHGGGQHRDRDGNRDPNYRPGQNGGQRDDQPPEMLEVDESEIISKEDLAATKSSMNLSVLKAKPIYELVKMAESMGVEGMARSRKQDIIFGILKAHSRNGENIYGDG